MISQIFNRKRRNHLLREQAKIDFQNARGTAHKYLLEKALSFYQEEIRSYKTQIKIREERISALKDLMKKKTESLEKEVMREIFDQIVYSELTEVPGIGEVLKDRIIREVYNGHINDLRYSKNVHGISEERQWQINLWIDKKLKDISSKISQILSQRLDFTLQLNEIKLLEEEILSIKTSVDQIEKSGLNYVNWALEYLSGVTEAHFFKAYTTTKYDDLIARYLIGIFPEWEPIPPEFRWYVLMETPPNTTELTELKENSVDVDSSTLRTHQI
jgi:hypothetical protein